MAVSGSCVRSWIPRRSGPLRAFSVRNLSRAGALGLLAVLAFVAALSCKSTGKDERSKSSTEKNEPAVTLKKEESADSTKSSDSHPSKSDPKRTPKTEEKRDSSTRTPDDKDRAREEKTESSDKRSVATDKKDSSDASNTQNRKDEKRSDADSSRNPKNDNTREKDNPRRTEESDEALVEIRRSKASKEIRPEDKTDGFVSDSAYQVFITVFARDESEAMRVGKADASRKALNLILKDLNRASENARKEMKRYVETNGEVIKVVQESRDSWSIVFRVQKEGMREFVKRLK